MRDTFFKERFFALLLLIIAGPPLLIWLVLIRPTSGAKARDQAALKELQIKIAETQSRLVNLEQAEGRLKEIPEAHKNKLLEMFPRGKNLEGLISELESLGASAGMVMATLDISDFVPARGEPPLPQGVGGLQIAVEWRGGDQNAFQSLVRSIEESARLLGINSIRFAVGTPSYTMTMKTQYLNEAFFSQRAPLQIDTAFFGDPRFLSLRGSKK